MDFDIAARRLQKDQQSLLAKSRASRNARNIAGGGSAKARALAESRIRAEKRLKEKKLEGIRNKRVVDAVQKKVVGKVEKSLGVVNVGSSLGSSNGDQAQITTSATASTANTDSLFAKSPLSSGWKLSPTSIHGEGDKIALPPSILETMTSGSMSELDPWGNNGNGRPLAFRIGVLNSGYSGFPSSEKMKGLVAKARSEVIALEKKEINTGSDDANEQASGAVDVMDDSDDENDETELSEWTEAYLEELSLRYLSYTHGTVVEFTQEDGCVGLPEPIAKVLLKPNSHSLTGKGAGGDSLKIPTKRTVDPASISMSNDEKVEGKSESMDVDDTGSKHEEDEESEKTPGHPAYNKFDIPDLLIEVTPITSLPAGKDCTLTPTATSIRNGFYGLKDVKMVLEQSLMRTRATLSMGDVIRTWRRGVSFDLIVSDVKPGGFGVVSCVNTDLNVDIGPPEDEDGNGSIGNNTQERTAGRTESIEQNAMGHGRTLLGSSPQPTTNAKDNANAPMESSNAGIPVTLRPEPAEGLTQGVCTVQIRGRSGDGKNVAGRRRFDVASATMADLFAFASHLVGGGDAFQLVTRFPRKVFKIRNGNATEEGCFDADATLSYVGIGEGQELLMLERL